LARRGDGAGEVTERDEVRAARPARAEAEPERHAAARRRRAERPPEVEAAPACTAETPGEPAAEPRAELAHERACLLDVARREVTERHAEELADARRRATAAVRGARVPWRRLLARRWLLAMLRRRPRHRRVACRWPLARRGRRVLARATRRARTAARTARP